MYRGRIRNNIYLHSTRNRYLYALWGISPPSVLKGFSLGIHALKKRGMACFWGMKIWKKTMFSIRERMYRGENV